jgi:hypothetical protein
MYGEIGKRINLNQNKMSDRKYIIQDLYHSKETIQFINEDTNDLENIWTTMWPKKKEKDGDYRPKLFDDIKEAKRYLTEIKRQAKADWSENSHIHRMYGFNKPEWDLYEHRG